MYTHTYFLFVNYVSLYLCAHASLQHIKNDRGLTLEALPSRGGGSAGCPKKGQEESETGE